MFLFDMCCMELLIVVVVVDFYIIWIIFFVRPNLNYCKTNSPHVSSRSLLKHFLAKNKPTCFVFFIVFPHQIISFNLPIAVEHYYCPNNRYLNNNRRNFDRNLQLSMDLVLDSKIDYLNNLTRQHFLTSWATILSFHYYYSVEWPKNSNQNGISMSFRESSCESNCL